VTDSPRWRCSLCGAEGSEDSSEANQAAAIEHAETHQGFKVGDRVQHKLEPDPVGYVSGVRVLYGVDWEGQYRDCVCPQYEAQDLVSAERRVEDRRKP